MTPMYSLLSLACLPALTPVVLFLDAARPDLASVVTAGIDSSWARLEGVTLGASPYRDKRVFCGDLDELAEREKATDADRKKLARSLAAELPKEAEDGYVWRLHELRARLLAPVDPKGRRDALASALAAYPDESYGEPSKHSLFHHLQNRHFASVWTVDGREAAETQYREALRDDARFAAVYGETLVSVYVERDAAEWLKPFVGSLIEAVQDRDASLVRSLKRIKAPDVRTLGGDPRKRFVVLGADREVAAPRSLVVVLPGGNGQALEFLPWLSELTAPLLDRYVFAVLSAPVWSDEQAGQVVWVTERWQRQFKASFAVEEFAREAVAALRAEDETLGKSYLFAWSSGGPATYRTLLSRGDTFAGAYVLASVFKPNDMKQRLKLAKGKRVYLEQGRADTVTALRFAQDAKQTLAKHGAETTLVPFDGGHGFAMPDAKKSLADALAWLSR